MRACWLSANGSGALTDMNRQATGTKETDEEMRARLAAEKASMKTKFDDEYDENKAGDIDDEPVSELVKEAKKLQESQVLRFCPYLVSCKRHVRDGL